MPEKNERKGPCRTADLDLGPVGPDTDRTEANLGVSWQLGSPVPADERAGPPADLLRETSEYGEHVLVCLDAHYGEIGAVAAGVLFADWRDSSGVEEVIQRISTVEPYRAGEFFKRELPCLLRVLDGIRHDLEGAIVDGYVWVDARGGRGLGAHLHRSLGGRVPVIGVAKSRFRHEAPSVEVMRGRSRRPLYVSAAGMDDTVAAERIKSMHGAFRLPTLLKRADELCRSGFLPGTRPTR